MTKYENKKETMDSGAILEWLYDNFPNVKGKPTGVETNADGTVKRIDIERTLTTQEKNKLTKKFSEL